MYTNDRQCILQWASLMTQTQVNNLKMIQQPQFTIKLLQKLDPDYFGSVFGESIDKVTLQGLFEEITKYYSREIGTNIKHVVGEDINVYSTNYVQQIWEMMIGIAIKGNNRENNINVILAMDAKNQQKLMRVVTRLMSRLGENVSSIEESTQMRLSKKVSSSYNINSNTDLMIQLSQQNEQLKESIEQLNYQIKMLKEDIVNKREEIQQGGQFRKQLFDIMIQQQNARSSARNLKSSSAKDQSQAILIFAQDLILQLKNINKEIHQKQQKCKQLEEINRDLKLAYSTVIIQLENKHQNNHETSSQIKNIQKELQSLRSQNIEYLNKQKEFLKKIQQLNQQKFYLKGIVQRFESKLNLSEEKIEELVAKRVFNQKRKIKQQSQQNPINQTLTRQTLRNSDHAHLSKDQIPENDRSKTVRYEINEAQEPTIRNKLQREVSHLQKKINSLQSQNKSLKKINNVLQKVINDFTAQSQQLMNKIDKQYEPMHKQFTQMIQSMLQASDTKDEQNAQYRSSMQKKLQELLQKLQSKLQQFESREKEYQITIKKLQKERDNLLGVIRQTNSHHKSEQLNLQNPASENKKQRSQISQQKQNDQIKQSKIQQKLNKQIEPEQNIISQKQSQSIKAQKQIEDNQLQVQIKIKVTQQKSQENTPASSQQLRIPKMETIGTSFISADDEQQKISYSYMKENRRSILQNSAILGITQKQPHPDAVSSYTSYIEQDSQHEQSDISQAKIIDITEIQEQLSKIKDKYLQIGQQNKNLYENCVSLTKIQQKQEQMYNKDQIKQTLKKYQQMLNKQIPKYPKVDQAAPNPQLVKIAHQNKALKQQLSSILKERNQILAKLKQSSQMLKLVKQSKMTEEQVIALEQKERMKRLGNMVKELKTIMADSNNQYVKLYNYFNETVKNSNKKQQGQNNEQYIKYMQMQKIRLNKQVSDKQEIINQLNRQINLLISALLDLRNKPNKSNHQIGVFKLRS